MGAYSTASAEHCYWAIESNLTTAADKGRARARLDEIARIQRKNEEGAAQYRVRQGCCPTCGRGPSNE